MSKKLRLEGTFGSKIGSLSLAGSVGTRPVIAALKRLFEGSVKVAVMPVMAYAPAGSVRHGLWPTVPQFGSGSTGATLIAMVMNPLALNPLPVNPNGTTSAYAGWAPNAIAR